MPMKWLIRGLLCFALLSTALVVGQEGQQQFASLGDFKLESGEVLRDCRVGYRIFGELAPDRSNAILFLTWFRGTSEDLIGLFGPGKLVDSSKYFIIAVDALADGVSTSPSNSAFQSRMKFPKITIRDMVNSQHQLLTQVLHLSHVKAVMGISMGGMQTFQWMVSYPDFMDKAIPIVGSPRLTPYDLLLCQAENEAIMNDPDWKSGEYVENPEASTKEIDTLAITTPSHYNRTTTREQALESAKDFSNEKLFDANNHLRQSQAIMAHDVSAPFGGSMQRAAARVEAQVLIVVNATDHMVNPEPALQFGRLLHARILALNNDCGHLAMDCEPVHVQAEVAAFLR